MDNSYIAAIFVIAFLVVGALFMFLPLFLPDNTNKNIDKKDKKMEDIIMNLKDKLLNTFGVLGGILYYAFNFLFCFAPVYVLPISMWWVVVITIVAFIFPAVYGFVSPILWIWGLVVTIGGHQDWVAIVFYVFFVLWFVVSFIPFIYNLFRAYSKNK